MKLWLIGGILVGLLGVSLYLGAVKRSTPTPTSGVAVVIAEAPKPIPASTPLAIQQVVEVTNIDHLLDPDCIVVHYPIDPGEPPQVGPKRIMIEGSTAGPERVIVNARPMSHIPIRTGENPNTILQAFLGLNSEVQVPVITRVGYEELPIPQPSVDVKPIPKALEESIGQMRKQSEQDERRELFSSGSAS